MKPKQKIKERYSEDPILPKVRAILGRQNSLNGVAERSTISISCLHAWMTGKTKFPQRITLKFALRACGYELSDTITPKKESDDDQT